MKLYYLLDEDVVFINKNGTNVYQSITIIPKIGEHVIVNKVKYKIADIVYNFDKDEINVYSNIYIEVIERKRREKNGYL